MANKIPGTVILDMDTSSNGANEQPAPAMFRIYDGEYFEIVKRENDILLVRCHTCGPDGLPLRSSAKSNGNILKHIKVGKGDEKNDGQLQYIYLPNVNSVAIPNCSTASARRRTSRPAVPAASTMATARSATNHQSPAENQRPLSAVLPWTCT